MIPKIRQCKIAETLNQNKHFELKEDYFKMILAKVTKNARTRFKHEFYFTLCEAV